MVRQSTRTYRPGAVKREMKESLERTTWYMKQRQFSATDKERARRVHRLVTELTLVAAMRDGCAFLHKHRRPGRSPHVTLLFGYRGTAVASDIWVDAQLALNVKNIERLDEARIWTRKVVKRMAGKVSASGYKGFRFFGHSLGGWVAEGVGNDYPGSLTATIEAGAPVFSWGSAYARAFNPRQPGARPPVRYVRLEDPVPLGEKHLGPGATVIKEKRVSVLNPIKNHFLANNIPWLDAPVPGSKVAKKPSLLQRSHAHVKRVLDDASKRASKAWSATKRAFSF